MLHIVGVKKHAPIKGSSTNIYLCGLLLPFHPGQSLVRKVAHLQVVVVLAVWDIFTS